MHWSALRCTLCAVLTWLYLWNFSHDSKKTWKHSLHLQLTACMIYGFVRFMSVNCGTLNCRSLGNEPITVSLMIITCCWWAHRTHPNNVNTWACELQLLSLCISTKFLLLTSFVGDFFHFTFTQTRETQQPIDRTFEINCMRFAIVSVQWMCCEWMEAGKQD